MQVLTAAARSGFFSFTGLQPTQFRQLVRLVAERGGDGVADGRPVIADGGYRGDSTPGNALTHLERSPLADIRWECLNRAG
ncbi:hypothetical protein IW248_000755 [Micromonospora ureilytica]|uniref:Uncharacterized protein n=1 Tax=Micromonospora ureilytica TaxID=709868 RepID=A0ABS0JBM8_9ACTN|nr:hypothetical protein [Micromonospora ureilytica]